MFCPSSVRFFFSLALSGFARSGLGVLVLVFLLLPLLFCVSRLVSRSSSCHLMSIVISFPCPFHLRLHLICWGLKKPRCCGACVCVCVCVCVCQPHKECKTSKFRRGPMGTWMARANEDPSKLLRLLAIFESWWGVANTGTTMPFFDESHTRIFEFSTWMDEGGFSFVFLHCWRNLRLRWISCPLQLSAYISEFFLASIDLFHSSRWRRKNFPFTPHQTPSCSCQV